MSDNMFFSYQHLANFAISMQQNTRFVAFRRPLGSFVEHLQAGFKLPDAESLK